MNSYIAIDNNNNKIALKILKNKKKNFKEKYQRFIDETKTLLSLSKDEMDGIIPILDLSLPGENKPNWYTMPIAIPLIEKLKNENNIIKIVECIISLTQSLILLHSKNIVHRDIKPSNLYFYQNKYCFGDFGLVDYPNKEEITQTKTSVGAKWTIAPEMKRNAKLADGKKADIYSLAKTLWILLTKEIKGFEGTYNSLSNLIGLKNKYPTEHLVELNEVLTKATSDDPNDRPTAEEFKNLLFLWLDVQSDFTKKNTSQWKNIQTTLFNNNIPESAQWTNIEKIIYCLNLISSMPDLNHIFFSSNGGLDLSSAKIANEKSCIELFASGLTFIIKPIKLIFENICDDYSWSYFRLELDSLEASQNNHDKMNEKSTNENESEIISEELVTEIEPGKYISWIHGNYGYYEDKPLPETSRLVNRILKGTFVIFAKASIYNDTAGTYDGRHAKFNSDEFKKYIIQMRDDWLIWNNEHKFYDYYNQNPFDNKLCDNSSIEKEIEEKEKLKSFIVNEINNFNFIDICKCASTLNYNIECVWYTISIQIDEIINFGGQVGYKCNRIINYKISV